MSLIEIKKKLLMAQKGGADISELFNTSLWTGNGATRTITTGIDSGEGSLLWIKNRGATVNHTLFDTIRGALNYLSTNLTNASTTQAGSLVGFDSSGYSLGTNSLTNTSTALYVGWQFRRAEKFFDIVQYTGDGVSGRQIAHSLGVKPGIIIVKRTDATSDWQAYHQSRTSTQYAVINSTAAFATASTRWNNTEPTSSNFTIGSDATVNASGGTYIAYLFAHDPSPEGLIQCGSYVGNGSATGPVVNLGWRPQYLFLKSATTTTVWNIFDSQRSPGTSDDALYPNNSSAEQDEGNIISYTSSGFQITTTSGGYNANGQTYIYMAIREA